MHHPPPKSAPVFSSKLMVPMSPQSSIQEMSDLNSIFPFFFFFLLTSSHQVLSIPPSNICHLCHQISPFVISYVNNCNCSPRSPSLITPVFSSNYWHTIPINTFQSHHSLPWRSGWFSLTRNKLPLGLMPILEGVFSSFLKQGLGALWESAFAQL